MTEKTKTTHRRKTAPQRNLPEKSKVFHNIPVKIGGNNINTVNRDNKRTYTTTKRQLLDTRVATKKEAHRTTANHTTTRGKVRPSNRKTLDKKLVKPRATHKSTNSLSIQSSGDNIRIIHLGGVEEVGRNMSLIEYKDEIIVIDMGFQFKEDYAPGIDFILPNTEYLEDRKDKIKAVVITHGHLDHIGGMPYILGKIGNPKIYARLLTTLMIKKRQEEFPEEPEPNMEVIETNATIKISDNLTLRFFSVTHTIPDAMGVIIDTPEGSIVHTGDLKLDHVNGVPTKKEEETFKQFEKENVLLLMGDSTNVERPGFSIPESTVNNTIEKLIKETSGRIILGSFASQLERAMTIIQFAEKYGRKVVVEGRSMKTNIAVAEEAGYLKHEKETVIPIKDIDKYPPNKILVLATGSQGEEFAALMRIANKSHRFIRLNKTDTVILSSSIVPGNERSVQNLKDKLSRAGAHIIHYQVSDIHSSGHANGDETLWIQKKIKPKFFIPVHGYHYMHTVHADIAHKSGIPMANIVIVDNGMITEIQDKGKRITVLKEKAPSELVFVDGFSVGNIQEAVIRDRTMLAQDGMFVVIAIVDSKTGRVRKSPDIISRGFVYLRESQDLLRQARYITKKTIEDISIGMNPINFDPIKRDITDNVGKFLFQQTAKKPIVLPVLIGV